MSRCFVFIDANKRWIEHASQMLSSGDEVYSLIITVYDDIVDSWKRITDNVFVEPLFDKNAIEKIIGIAFRKFGESTHVYCETDRFLYDVSLVCRDFSIPFTCADAIVKARNKAETRKSVLPSSGLISIHSDTLSGLNSAAKVVGFPCVLKPAMGTGSCLAYPAYADGDIEWFVHEAQTSLAALPQDHRWFAAGGWICETYLKGPLVTVFVMADGRKVEAFGHARNIRQTLSECIGMGSIISGTGNIGWQEILQYAENCCRDIGLDLGIFDVEIILTSDGPVLVEVNPRPPGGEMLSALSLVSDVDIFSYMIEIYAGSQHPTTPYFGRDVLIWKIVSAEDGNICSDVGAAIDVILGGDTVSHKLLYIQSGEVGQLDCIARVLIPALDGREQFRCVNEKIGQLSKLLGVDLLRGDLPQLPWEKGPK